MEIPITHPDDGQLVTTATASAIAGVVPDTLRGWRRQGRIIPACVTPTGVALYRRGDVERATQNRVERRSTRGTGEAA